MVREAAKQSCWLALALALITGQSLLAQTATYDVVFTADWTAATHPLPGGAHFSSLVGATHNDSVSFWEPGGIASDGIERMAESGSVISLRNEVIAVGSENATPFIGAGLGNTGSVTSTIEVPIDQPLFTLVTMIAPSPDWFIGTHGYDLRADGFWLDGNVVDLPAYDAGTDNGANFTSSNSNTNPQEPISQLGAPLGGLPPLGTFTFNLVSVDGLTGDFDADGDYSTTDVDALVASIVAGNDSVAFDLTGDGQVDSADLESWLAEAGAAELESGNSYLVADANLDGGVDVADFNLWNANRFTTDAGWSGGDFNADGATDVSDFNLFNANKFTSADGAGGVNTVPEPASWMLFVLGGFTLVMRRRR